ncbi:MAG: transglutaminase domain-containing protein [Prevotellaceae bacterium]|nr:transglutaminase domain-containing protein [Prevotellaceae bacterium]
MKKYLLIVGTVLFIFTAFTDCRRRGPRTSKNKKEKVVTPKIIPEEKRDTVYFIVPTEPDVAPTEPNAQSDEQDFIVVPTIKKLKPIEHTANLPTPPKIIFQHPTGSHTRQDYINQYNITGDMKELIIACNYDNKTVRNNALALVSMSPGEFNLGQICDIFDFCYQNWSYVNDPVTIDYYAKASETLRNGLNGDCDDFAILLCSMILSIGGEARINFAYDATSGHAFTEVNIGTTNQSNVQNYLRARYSNADMWHRADSSGNVWLNMDWQAQYPGGRYWKYNNGTSFNIIRNIYENL